MAAILEPGDEVELTISGELTDGTPFEGSDTIKVIEKECFTEMSRGELK